MNVIAIKSPAIVAEPIAIKRREPALSDHPDYGRAFYPDPPSHDFCVWLIIAELMRCHHGVVGPLRVRFGLIKDQLGMVDFGPLSPWSGRAYPFGCSRAYSDEMMANVLRPAIEMIGAVEEPAVNAPFDFDDLAPYVEYDYHIGHLVDAGRQGHRIPNWKLPQWAHDEVRQFLGRQRPVIITLRETGVQPERNSQMAEWLKFAESVEGDHPVLFLRDTAKADERLALPFPTWPLASRNAYVRAALYRHALVNMFVGNGPSIWCIFSDAPFLIFKQLVPALPNWAHGRAEGWKDQDHMDIGDQYPWASASQRLTWTDDTFEDIRAAFDQFMALLDNWIIELQQRAAPPPPR